MRACTLFHGALRRTNLATGQLCPRWVLSTFLNDNSWIVYTLPEACGTKQLNSMRCPGSASCLAMWTHQQAFGVQETVGLLTRRLCAHAADHVAGWQANVRCWRNHSVQRLLLSVVVHACVGCRMSNASCTHEELSVCLHACRGGHVKSRFAQVEIHSLYGRRGKLMMLLGYDVDV